jgi:hypothetical protein
MSFRTSDAVVACQEWIEEEASGSSRTCIGGSVIDKLIAKGYEY